MKEIRFGKTRLATAAVLCSVLMPAIAQAQECKLKYAIGSESSDRMPYTDLKTLGDLKLDKEVNVGVVLKTLSNQYWAEVKRGAEAAGGFHGAKVTVQVADDESSQSQQLTIAQVMVDRGYDAYVIAPQTNSNLTPAIKTIMSNCKPLVEVIEPGVMAATYIGADERVVGRQAADFLATSLASGDEVAHIEGQAGSDAGAQRTEGFTKGAEAHGFKLVASVPADWDQTKAFNATQELLKRFPNIKGIYAANDTMALGVAAAVKAAGLTGKIKIVGTDAVPAAIDLIRRGEMDATNTPFPYYQGCKAVEAVLRQYAGQKVPAWVDSAPTLINSANVDAFFQKDGVVIDTGSCETPAGPKS
ncbi:hypothetical protein ATER59S_00444 [Aquamicrobium terrae]